MDAFLESACTALDEHGGVNITSLEWSEDALVVHLQLVKGDTPPGLWRLNIQEVREHRAELGWCYDLGLHQDHPLLWPHLEHRVSLYFSARPTATLEAVGRLWSRHHRETDGWLPFDRFLNAEVPLDALLDGGSGLLASGPERLLRAYGDELDRSGVPWSLAGRGAPKEWDQTPVARLNEWGPLPEGKPFRAFTLGESYVVGGRFTASSV